MSQVDRHLSGQASLATGAAPPARLGGAPSAGATTEFVGVAKRFWKGDTPVDAIGHVELVVRPGEFLGIVGPSGCGKSTLLNLAAGLMLPTAGEVRFQGQSLLGVPPHQVATRGIGRTFQGEQHRPAAGDPWPTRAAQARAGRPLRRARRAEGLRAPLPVGAVRRHAQARRAGAHAGQRPRDAANGRAVRGTRRAAPPADARGDAAHLGA
ncbi:MAG: ATP-binding cassette domain-containing protein [Chloroflexi bacterium]|nr:ATP-binding cassette domain-containing protein [Chloroflexota bacterium]